MCDSFSAIVAVDGSISSAWFLASKKATAHAAMTRASGLASALFRMRMESSWLSVISPMSHPRQVQAQRLVAAVRLTALEADVALAAHDLDSIADGFHRALPAFVLDRQALERQHVAGADVARRVDAEGVLHQQGDLRPRIDGPFGEAFVNQFLGRLQAFVEHDAVGDGALDAQLAVEAEQLHVALVAAQADAVFVGGQVHERLDVFESG